MDTLYIFGDNITHYKTESVHFWGLINSATKWRIRDLESTGMNTLVGVIDIGVRLLLPGATP